MAVPVALSWALGQTGGPLAPTVNFTQLGVAGVTVVLLVIAIVYLWQENRRIRSEAARKDEATLDRMLGLVDQLADASHAQGDANREVARALVELRDKIQLLLGEERSRARR